MKHPNDIIILCDPDFALLRPITDDFSNPRETLSSPRRSAHFTKMSSHIVTHGQPYAQTYGLGTQWRKFNLDEIAGPDSPAKEVDQMNGGLFYPAGPPYIGTASDMYKIAVAWSEFAPRVYKEYPHLLAEMVSVVMAGLLYTTGWLACFVGLYIRPFLHPISLYHSFSLSLLVRLLYSRSPPPTPPHTHRLPHDLQCKRRRRGLEIHSLHSQIGHMFLCHPTRSFHPTTSIPDTLLSTVYS